MPDMHPRPTLDSKSWSVLERRIIIIIIIIIIIVVVVVISVSTLRCGIAVVFDYKVMNTASQAATHIHCQLLQLHVPTTSTYNHHKAAQSHKKGTVHIKFPFDSVQPDVVESG
jgi:flagellar basal body-associated protein FliL